MAALAHRSWLSQLLRLMPASLHAALDAWSYGLAQERAHERRLAAQPKTPPAAAIDYKLRPWRD